MNAKLTFLKNSKGMTIMEVIISVVLIALVVVALFAALTQSAVFSKRIDLIYVASYIAQSRIDALKKLDFDQIDLSDETDVRVDEIGNLDLNGKYLRSTEITADFDGNSYLKKVKVSVKRMKVNIDGTIDDPITFEGQPIIMETLLADMD